MKNLTYEESKEMNGEVYTDKFFTPERAQQLADVAYPIMDMSDSKEAIVAIKNLEGLNVQEMAYLAFRIGQEF